MNENFRDKNSHGDTETQSVAGTQSDKLPNQTSPEKNILEQEQKMSFGIPRPRASARENWKRVKLGEVCSVSAGGTPSRANPCYWNGSIPWVKIGDFSGKYLSQTSEKISDDGLQNSSAKIFPEGTVLFSIFATLGEVAILNISAATNQAIAGIQISENLITQDFLYHFFISQKERILKAGRGVAQNNINLSILRNLEIPLPPLEVQKRIAGTLDKVRELIDLRERELAKFDELVKCRFIEMFGDPVTNPKGWEIEKIGELCEIVSGSTPRTEKEEYWGGKNLWITPAEISENDFIISHTERTLSDLGVRSAALRLLPAGTVLLSSRAPIGKIAISGIEMYCNQGFKNLICGTRIRNIFMWAFLRERKDFLVSLGRGATFKEISKTIVENISVPVPPLSLQEEFARFVGAVDKSKFSVSRWIFWAERFVIRSVLLKFGA